VTRHEAARVPARCADPACRPEIVVVVLVDGAAIAGAVSAALGPRLTRIERALRRMGVNMSELDDKLTVIEQAEVAEAGAIDRALKDLAELKAELADAGSLSDEQAGRLDAIAAQIAKGTSDIDAADPAPAPVDEPPVA
jgi:hypothetical protein